ncbi:MAG: LAGLIDADG family homing endonuclease [Candidatus Moranbacteria bacterium]|jgi:intein-encoded DNA endonuclease-like protein|nr:LAGLIDADG family homing endonuclease [Candidatus Moranbacteria bacterium]MDD5652132.1 LAGLIDADG family homing endonuclease [Candidatus Moranbacteria bacterium]MDX9855704.1 LAGLIDADG family homing endonuclease [Candidatus Moranbacteria bacterium]
MSDKVSSAGNQQGSRSIFNRIDPSETTRQTPFSQKEVKAYFLGALHDATFSSNRRYRFSQKGTDWLLVLKKQLKDIGYNSWIYREGKNRSVYVLETLASFLDFKVDPTKFKTIKEKISYIRGFFDAEGGIPRNGGRFYIQLVQSDKEKINKLKIILDELEIKTGKIHNPSKRVDPNYWRIYVLSDSHKKFAEIINSWHPRKIKILRKRMKI